MYFFSNCFLNISFIFLCFSFHFLSLFFTFSVYFILCSLFSIFSSKSAFFRLIYAVFDVLIFACFFSFYRIFPDLFFTILGSSQHFSLILYQFLLIFQQFSFKKSYFSYGQERESVQLHTVVLTVECTLSRFSKNKLDIVNYWAAAPHAKKKTSFVCTAVTSQKHDLTPNFRVERGIYNYLQSHWGFPYPTTHSPLYPHPPSPLESWA